MAKSIVTTSEIIEYGGDYNHPGKMMKRINCVLTVGTAADPDDFTVTLPGGMIMSIMTDNGGTALTDSYNLRLLSPFGSGIDVLGGALDGRSNTVDETKQPVPTGNSTPTFIKPGDYTIRITGNIVNDASVTVEFLMIEGQ